MSRESVLNHLLHQDEVENPNALLFKKYLLCIYNGWFRINDCSPDENCTLGDYLLDDERIVFDFTRLSPQSKDDFFDWFVLPHSDTAHRALLSGVATNDYRGHTAEVGLSWWGRITNQLFYKKKSYQWTLSPLELNLNYQLNGIEMCEGENGLLIGLQQIATEDTGDKYSDPSDDQQKPLRNTKRLYLTDQLVKKLMATNLKSQNYSAMMSNAHPFSVPVTRLSKRYEKMHEYRQAKRYISVLPWYIRLWRWVKSWFVKGNPKEIEMQEMNSDKDKKFKLLIKEDDIRVSHRPKTREILIKEKRPELDSMIFCGGGAKIFAHVGAYKAFEDAHIKPTKFAGSSAGAIMASLCYLGYSSKEIFEFFQGFRQDILVHYDIDRSGMSDSRALKAALDFMITKKINQIIKKYNIEGTVEGKRFLTHSVFKNGKVTFESLKALKMRYPDCGLGDELIITATNLAKQKTRYFSFTQSPKTEVSFAITLSASLPIIFKPTIFEGEIYNDAGLTSNLPTEAIRDDHSTLLESEHGNCLSLVVFQFDNGHERGILDKLLPKGVYRENFLLNWVYSKLTGVEDTASAWQRDRLKVLQHSNQVVLISADVSATQFDVEPDVQTTLFNNGYEPAKNYINTRYDCDLENPVAINKEYMATVFDNIEEALYYCCYRGRQDWFEKLSKIALQQGMSQDKVNALRIQHFSPIPDKEPMKKEETILDERSGFKTHLSALLTKKKIGLSMQLFESIYPVFIKIPDEFVKNPLDLKLFKAARHCITLNDPLSCLKYLEKIKGNIHILLKVLIKLLGDYKLGKLTIDEMCFRLSQYEALLSEPHYQRLHSSLFGQWELSDWHTNRVINAWEQEQWVALINLCECLKNDEEPMQTIVRGPHVDMAGIKQDPIDCWIFDEQETGTPILNLESQVYTPVFNLSC